jgi:hypothetical protein
MGEIPDWLTAALEAHPRPASRPWQEREVGSVCVAEGGGGRWAMIGVEPPRSDLVGGSTGSYLAQAAIVRRHVLVVALEPEFAQVELLTNEVDLGGARDVPLPRGETGLPYDLLLERDLTAPVFRSQLGPPLGAVDPAGLEGRPPAGAPIVSRRDGRWAWKLRELADLHALAAGCLRSLLGPGDP